MTHPLVKEIATKIATKRKTTNNLIAPIEVIIESVIKEIDVAFYSINNALFKSKQLTLSEALTHAEKNKLSIIHLPSKSNNVEFMLQAYEFYANKGCLGTPQKSAEQMVIQNAPPNAPPQDLQEAFQAIQLGEPILNPIVDFGENEDDEDEDDEDNDNF